MTSDRHRVRQAKPRRQKVRDRLENDPRFLRRIEKARKSLRAERGVRLEDVK